MVLLIIIQGKEVSKPMNSISLAVGPILASAVLLLLTSTHLYQISNEDLTVTRFDKSLDIAAVLVSFLSLLVTATSLAFIHRYKLVASNISSIQYSVDHFKVGKEKGR